MLALMVPAGAHAAARQGAPATLGADGRSWAETLWQRLLNLIAPGPAGGGRPAATAAHHGTVSANQSTASNGSNTGPADSSTINPDG